MRQAITTIRRGLEIPVAGEPVQQIPGAVLFPPAVALLGADFHGLRPALAVRVGERVEAGQVLFSDKDRPGVVFTAPCAATVVEIRRGAQRVFQALVLEPDAGASDGPALGPAREDAELAMLDAAVVRAQLLTSGLWTALRTRPYSLLPAADATPRSIFVTALDTHPLAADPALIIAAHADDFRRGIV
ncbi:MAG: NADH:ubiquinone reductase (Na(+)-transporting) subunit A, partial [Candidatus Accumulibacter sp.]|nr:NADH:ubiquinone reductase (Na(+)-transporting) subunit A [Accumulibacter sp.]